MILMSICLPSSFELFYIKTVRISAFTFMCCATQLLTDLAAVCGNLWINSVFTSAPILSYMN